MKIGILTFHASHNFGSMLQNYALQQFLIAEGHSVETINLRNDKQRYMYHYPLCIGRNNPTLLSLLGKVRDPRWLFKECKTWNLFEHFLKHHLNLTKEFKNWDEIMLDLPTLHFDAIITGGDQIWNTFCYDFDWAYFLPDNIKTAKKIAFSPSFGNKIEKMKEDSTLFSKIKKYLEDFDYLSVREKDAGDFFQKQLNMTIPVIADPTILVNTSVYLNLIKKPIFNEPYIYYYTPSHITDTEAEDIAIKLSELLNIKVVTSYSRFRKKTKMISVPSGPTEFLNLVHNAQFVIGKSFHLVVFSILFHKNFITIKSQSDPRMSSLLNKLRISNRNINSANDYKKIVDNIDYDTVDNELSKFRKDAISYLQKSLN